MGSASSLPLALPTLRLAPLQSAHALFKQGALSRLLLTPFGKWARVYRLILDPRGTTLADQKL
jgi:hypothetical protein